MTLHSRNQYNPISARASERVPCDRTVAPSFNGRTADSGSAYRGSNPWGAANLLSRLIYSCSNRFTGNADPYPLILLSARCRVIFGHRAAWPIPPVSLFAFCQPHPGNRPTAGEDTWPKSCWSERTISPSRSRSRIILLSVRNPQLHFRLHRNLGFPILPNRNT